jgi:tellurite resistance protein TerC
MQIYWNDATKTTEYFVGYLVEKSLSVDNIFVFTLIFAALKTPKKLQQLALMWGILLALVLRGIMILIGAALIERFEWIIWFFGAFLLFTGVQMLRTGGHANESEPSAIKLARRFIHVNNDFNEERFWVIKAGKRVFTPIFLTIAVIGIIDLVFAVDSIPAIFGITSDPFIVFTSNAFAILGLRNLYFLLADAKDRFHYLSAGLGFVLMWIGVKMILPAIDHDWKVPPLVSLVVVISILTISIVASLLRTRRIARKAPRATKARRPARARKR